MKQLYMWRHSESQVCALNGARKSPNNAGGAWNQNPSGAIYDLQKKMREMKKTVLHNLNVYMNYAFDLLTKACLFEHRGLIPGPGRLQWDICFNYARQKSLTWQRIYQTFFFFFLPPPLSCPSLLSRVWDGSRSVACRWDVVLCTLLQMNIWPAYWFHVWKWDPSE